MERIDWRNLGKRIFSISGQASAGKSTVVEAIVREYPQMVKLIPRTTSRPPRTGEQEGVDYYFISKEEFLGRKEAGKFIAEEEFAGNYYGIEWRVVEEALLSDPKKILIMGGLPSLELKQKIPSATIIYLWASLSTLKRRMEKVGRNRREIEERMKEAESRNDWEPTRYDHVLHNEDGYLDGVAKSLAKIIGLSSGLSSAIREIEELGHQVEYIIDRTPTLGGVTALTQSGNSFIFFKTGPEVLEEYQKYQQFQLVCPSEHLPKVRLMYYAQVPFITYPYIEGWPFSEAVLQGRLAVKSLLASHAARLQIKKEIWLKTMKNYDPSVAKDTQAKILDSVEKLLELTIGDIPLAEVKEIPIVIEGRFYPPLQDLLECLYNFQQSQVMVFDHADSHGDNVIIDPQGNWFLVDWQRVGWFSWMEAIVRELLWWKTEYSTVVQQIRVERKELHLDYSLSLPEICYQLEKMSAELADSMASKGKGEDIKNSPWKENFAILQAVQFIRRMIHHPRYYLPPRHIEVALLGEIVKILNQ